LILLPVGLLRRLQPSKKFFLLIFFAGPGFLWAALMAQLHLSDTHPHEWEGRDIQLVGVVASLPQMQERGERFLFDVEMVETADAPVPQHISITRYFAGYRDSVQCSATGEFYPGERWRLSVRLKQTHGSYNLQGFDFEAWALERNIRATGYIHKSSENARLHQPVYRPAYIVDRLREQARQRFQAVLRDAPYAGVLLALAIGYWR
jgi:competence protein ComEC